LDATVSDAMSPHPLFVDIYGYCGLSLFSEFMNDGTLTSIVTPMKKGYLINGNENSWGDTKQPLLLGNDLTPMQKLNYSLDMAEAVALLHNRREGVIVHGDVWLDQFLVDKKTNRVKLIDFNNAHILQYDEEHREYCPYLISFGRNRVSHT
jgi:serine/threonine protein kinase